MYLQSTIQHFVTHVRTVHYRGSRAGMNLPSSSLRLINILRFFKNLPAKGFHRFNPNVHVGNPGLNHLKLRNWLIKLGSGFSVIHR